MAREMKIRKAGPADTDAIVELWKQLIDFSGQYDEYWSRFESGHEDFAAYLSSHIEDDAFCVLVAEAGEGIVGYCLSEIRQCKPRLLQIEQYGHIANLVVTEEYRGQGLGEELLRQSTEWFAARGVHRVEAFVSAFNEPARRFWAKMRFAPYLEAVFLEI